MAKSKANGWKKNGMVKLKVAAEKLLQRSISKKEEYDTDLDLDYGQDGMSYNSVPDDVKKGHFVVMATGDGGKPKRHVVALSYLTNPAFRELLEKVAEEYGFYHGGALTVPCRSSELECILMGKGGDVDDVAASNIGWEASKSTMVWSC
ncbi:hypothetical protein C5167_001165 [Papaver somniferum]|uniref:Uncharacterized protein n=1 Tax=Papaver somniferum TaxID=3469 RepID=A0A4Y7KXT7_PAPSO|nr:auxin-responsive protein SAUR40-like [Papaver somniferum]RZC76998.1 hypothetical protein C5167_001165 [Papaver somniferum]